MTYRRKGHAEHDNQSYVPPGEIERWARENDPLDRYSDAAHATSSMSSRPSCAAIDDRVARRDRRAPPTSPSSRRRRRRREALVGVYADPPARRAPVAVVLAAAAADG